MLRVLRVVRIQRYWCLWMRVVFGCRLRFLVLWLFGLRVCRRLRVIIGVRMLILGWRFFGMSRGEMARLLIVLYRRILIVLY